jgi:hypothetical protein
MTAAAESAPLPCRIYMPGAMVGNETQFNKVMAAVNKSLKVQGYNIDVTVTYIAGR